MKCPFCKTEKKPGVTDTIGYLPTKVIRTRFCKVCERSFTTTEYIDLDDDFNKKKAEYEQQAQKAYG